MTMEIAFFGRDWWNHAHAVAAALRERGAVHHAIVPWGEQEIPVWVIARYSEARDALSDPRLSKDGAGLIKILNKHLTVDGKEPELSAMFTARHMVFLDPPDHTRLRRVLAKHFTRGRIDRLKPRIEKMTAKLVDDLALGRPEDLISGMAFPLPLYVICELIGVPEEKRGALRAWTYALMEDLPDRAKAASLNMQTYLIELINTAHANPGDDLLSALVQETADEDRLSMEELLGTLFLLFVAGHETTTALIGNSLAGLLTDNGYLWREVGQRPELLPGVIKEFSRYDSAVATATHRYTTEPVTIGGTTIPAGEIVLVSLLSANRDERQFGHADQIDIFRKEPNLAFGHGIHHCLGVHLAFQETEIALGTLTRRFPAARMAVDKAELVRRQPAIIPNSLADLLVILGSAAVVDDADELTASPGRP
ncbi:cytochrome P450 family protein [Amycolatopsis sp. cmx-4-61]|uniref:cytochrome P450 family protein n=1 Tax=Amycolatopsis sp. cmx-4-61 TaxID=2790937 RepID=UPI00397AEB6E